MTPTKVVNIRRESYDVLIDRRSKWGNPFRLDRDGTRTEVIAKYQVWIQTQPQLLASLSELKGKRLGCWCAPLPCHGDILAELTDEFALFEPYGPAIYECGHCEGKARRIWSDGWGYVVECMKCHRTTGIDYFSQDNQRSE